jgi:glycosyltransferase involved in cell wall biosynthesis
MKILVITSILPFPLTEGGKTSQYVYLLELVKENKVTLGCIGPSLDKDIVDLQQEIPNLKIVNCFKTSEEPKRKFKDRFLVKLIWELSRLLTRKQEKAYENEFFKFPVRPREESNYLAIENLIKNNTWDIVQVDFIDNADLALIIPTELKKVLVVHDIRFASVQQSLTHSKFSKAYIEYFSKVVQTSELSYLKLFDGLVTFSNEDKHKLAQNLTSIPILAVPFGISDSLFKKDLPKNEKIKQLIFLGSDGHIPNADAVQWYAEEFSEDIFSTFGLILHVIGNWSESGKEKFEKRKSIHFTGFVDDLSAYAGNSVMVVPLRIGSGIRTKILEAFALGIPVISTSVGAEGIGAVHKNELLIADQSSEFLSCLEQLQDTNLRNNLVFRARLFAENNFSQTKTANDRVNFFKQILN